LAEIQPKTIDDYISGFPEEVRIILGTTRRIIRETAPGAQETISYGIPTFKLNGANLVHFAAFAHHIGFYPTSSGISTFSKELAPFSTSRGTVRFPLEKPIPYELIKTITEFRVKEVRGTYR
jgi:uncharacterized protein YdhG (YjbR/CyaY superfamily)